MKILKILIGVLIVFSMNSNAATLTVGAGEAYTTIESALAVAGDGDEIYILNGTYTPASTLIVDGGRTLTFRGESAAGVLVDGSTAGRLFSVRGASLPWLLGSVVHINRLTITNANVTGNGGGVEFQLAAANGSTIDSTFFINCSASGSGGAIYADTKFPQLTECYFSSNSAGSNGGAVFFDVNSGSSQNTITNCTFEDNSTGGDGSAIALDQSTTVSITIDNSTFGLQSSSSGSGAVYQNCTVSGAQLVIKNSTIANNSDGGIKIDFSSTPTVNIYNTLFDQNNTDITSSSSLTLSAESSIIQTINNISIASASNVLGTHPNSLVNNYMSNYGQFTKTFKLSSFGVAVAVDAANAGYSNSTGQNGIFRGTPDIGSYEFDEADIYRWVGTTSSWSTGSNWSTGVVPPSVLRPEYVIIGDCSTYSIPTSSTDFIVPSKLIIRQDGALDLSGNAYVYLDTLMILSNENASTNVIETGQLRAQIANFLVYGTQPNTYIQQFLKGGKWNFLSSISENGIEVQNLVPDQTLDTDYWVATYDQEERANNGHTDAAWNYISSGTSLAAATGYIVWADRDMRAVFNSYNPNNDAGTNLNYTNSSAGGDINKGWNLVGNPFICPVDWDLFTNPSGKIDQAMYYYNSQYQTYFTYVGGVFSPSSNRGKVPPVQSFFVKTNTDGASLTFTTSMQTIDLTSTFYKAQVIEDKEVARLSILKPNTIYFDEVFFRHMTGATMHYNGQFDGYKLLTLNPEVPQIYTKYLNEEMSINSVDFEEDPERIFSLGYKNLTVDSVYKIAFESLGDDLGMTYILEDKKNGMSYTLAEGDTIEFIASESASDSRFVLKSQKNVVYIPKIFKSNIAVYSQVNQINIDFKDNIYNGPIVLYDVSGKLMRNENLHNYSGQYSFENLKSGIYILKYEGDEGFISEKLVVN